MARTPLSEEATVPVYQWLTIDKLDNLSQDRASSIDASLLQFCLQKVLAFL